MPRKHNLVGYRPVHIYDNENIIFIHKDVKEKFEEELNAIITLSKLTGALTGYECYDAFNDARNEHMFKFHKDGFSFQLRIKRNKHRTLGEVSLQSASESFMNKAENIAIENNIQVKWMTKYSIDGDSYETLFGPFEILKRVL